ncbi:MAG: ATPase, T2SS/T4P/T4SS family [Myxococcota bacterium]
MTEIGRSVVGVTTFLVPGGPLNDAARSTELRETIDACIADRELCLVIDLSGVAVINGEALELLLDSQTHLARLGGELKVTNANAALTDVFRITRISDHIAALDAPTDQTLAHPARKPGGRVRKLGEFLVENGLVTEETIGRALEVQKKSGERLAQILVDKGWVPEKDLLGALGAQLGVPFVWLRSGIYDPAAACLIEAEIARRLKVMPLFRVRGILYLATSDPQSVPVIDSVEDLTDLKVKPVLACTDEILNAIAEVHAERDDLSEYLGDLGNDLELVESGSLGDQDAIDELAGASPVINLINGIIQRAVRDGASDIHIEPSRTQCRVRLRVDGALYTVMTPPPEVHPALVSRLKVMANLDIAERRLPQDGRIQVVTRGRIVDLRFSSLPGIFGEKIVLRVLDKDQAILDVDRLGMSESNRDRFKELLSASYGLILATGPTGSGKTTSLYAAMNYVNSSEKNLITIEDPVEYQIEGLNQNQVKEGIGLSFAKMLKHVLRQDPDVVMVGEIREHETAEIAVQAALTGHLVLSTLHTNDSLGALTRMLDMGIAPYLLSSALIGVMAQRLVRTVCGECRTSYVPPKATLEQYGIDTAKKLRLTRGRGCSACYDSGYKGRIAIHEIIECDAALQRLIVSNPSRDCLDEFVREREIKTLRDDGIERALASETTLEEVFRVIG